MRILNYIWNFKIWYAEKHILPCPYCHKKMKIMLNDLDYKDGCEALIIHKNKDRKKCGVFFRTGEDLNYTVALWNGLSGEDFFNRYRNRKILFDFIGLSLPERIKAVKEAKRELLVNALKHIPYGKQIGKYTYEIRRCNYNTGLKVGIDVIFAKDYIERMNNHENIKRTHRKTKKES